MRIVPNDTKPAGRHLRPTRPRSKGERHFAHGEEKEPLRRLPLPIRSAGTRHSLCAIRAGLLHPCRLCIPSDRAGGIRRRRDGNRHAKGCDGGKNQVFHCQVSYRTSAVDRGAGAFCHHAEDRIVSPFIPNRVQIARAAPTDGSPASPSGEQCRHTAAA
jgi:hypothetical protein